MRYITTFAALLAAGLLAPLPAVAIDAAQVAADPAAAWEEFLDSADAAEVYSSFTPLLADLGYGADGVDAGACAAHAGALADAVATVPTSLALRRAALLCAEADGREEDAERELEALLALSRLAWSQVSDEVDADPLRIVHPVDAYAFLVVSGLEFRYDFYEDIRPAFGRMPMSVAAWDPETGSERVIRFDPVDTASRLDRGSPFAGFPFLADLYADAFIEGQAAAGEYIAADVRALRSASAEPDAVAKVGQLRAAAQAGGVVSGAAWGAMCKLESVEGCDEGFVDTWLPAAEQGHGMPLFLLAAAHAWGIGVERSTDEAQALLDLADGQFASADASVALALLWSGLDADSLPEWLSTRLQEAADAGELAAHLAMAELAILRSEPLPAGTAVALAAEAANRRGRGFETLARHEEALGNSGRYQHWLEKAAGAGQPRASALHGFRLVEELGASPDDAEVLSLMRIAAMGGEAGGAMYLAYEAIGEGRWSDAEGWLLAPAGRGHVEPVMLLAQLYEYGYPGLHGDITNALAAYQALAPSVPDARRQLAAMAMDGRGMEQDVEAAREWLRADAAAGELASATLLAATYLYERYGTPDPEQAMNWLQPALDAGHDEAVASYGAWLYYNGGDGREAIEVLEAGRSAANTMVANNLAWLYCTAADPELRDPAAGLEVARTLGDESRLAGSHMDTLAACHAANGDFDAAVRVQAQALENALRTQAPALAANADGESGSDGSIAGFEERLSQYRSGQPFIETVGE